MNDLVYIFKILLRLIFLIGIFAGLFYAIKNIVKHKKNNKNTYKLLLVVVVLCLCLILGVIEPNLKPNIQKNMIINFYCYLSENSDFSQPFYFNTGNIKGTCSFYDNTFLGEHSNRENIFISNREDYFYYGDVEYITIYYQPTKCKRWEGGHHFPVDIFGVPNAPSPTNIYLVAPSGVVFISIEYIETNPLFLVNPIVSSYFFYRPQIDFDEITPFIKEKQGTVSM